VQTLGEVLVFGTERWAILVY